MGLTELLNGEDLLPNYLYQRNANVLYIGPGSKYFLLSVLYSVCCNYTTLTL